MNNLQGATVLLICPRFFSYEEEIKKCIESFGATVFWFDERPSNSFSAKVVIRLNKNALARKISRYYQHIMEVMREKVVDYVFFVNPEAVTKKNIHDLRNLFHQSKFILYMWDSFDNKKKSLEILPFFDEKFTFDPRDSSKYGLKFRPLFFIDEYCAKADRESKYDLLFIGTAHSDRYLLVKRIIRQLPDSLRTKLYFFLSSRKLFILKKLLDRNFQLVNYRDINFKSLSHSDVAQLMQRSEIILDINHPKQVGLTMRTIEAIGAQRKLMTTNKSIVEYDFYSPSNIGIIERDKVDLDDSFLKGVFQPYNKEILFKYSLKGWIHDIFNLKSDKKS